MSFCLHPTLARDTFQVTDLPLCRVLLMNDRQFPWLILVPREPDLREIIDLPAALRHQLMDEIALTSDVLRIGFTPDKLNIAALGNQVEQLHVHVIARFKNDPAWPAPVWGKASQPYSEGEPVIRKLQALFAAPRDGAA